MQLNIDKVESRNLVHPLALRLGLGQDNFSYSVIRNYSAYRLSKLFYIQFFGVIPYCVGVSNVVLEKYSIGSCIQNFTIGLIVSNLKIQKSLCDPPRLIYGAYICADKDLVSWWPEIDREQLPKTDFLEVVKVPIFIHKIRQNAAKMRFF